MSTFAKRHELTAGIAVAAVLGGFSLVLLSIVWGGFWAGLTLSILWGWFVVPVFALPALSVWQAYGLVLVAGMLRGMKPGEKPNDGFGAAMFKAFLLPPFVCGLVLPVGWAVKAWA